jgi:hypothetical protein
VSRQLGIVAAAVGIHEKIVHRFLSVSQHSGPDLRVHVVTELEPFTRAAARNEGILEVLDTCDIIVCTDIDMLVPYQLVDYTRSVVRDGVALWAKCRNVWAGHQDITDPAIMRRPVREDGTGSWIAMTTADWLNVGGWDERITTYGGEDDVLAIRRDEANIHTETTAEFPLLHVNHPRRRGHGWQTGQANLDLGKTPPPRNFLTGRRWQLDEYHNHFNIFVTSRCTRRCPECSQRGLQQAFPDYELTMGQLEEWIRCTQQSGYRKYTSVILTGGEPLLWPHLEEAVEMLAASEVAEQINVFTNGDRAEAVTDAMMASISTLRISHYGDNKSAIGDLKKRYGHKVVAVPRQRHFRLPQKLSGPEVLPADCQCQGPALIGSTVYGCAMLVTVAEELGLDLEKYPESYCRLQVGYLELLAGFPRVNHECCRGCIGNRKLRREAVHA